MKHNKDTYILVVYAVLAVSAFIAFEPLRHNEFVDYDDASYVTDNPNVKGGITGRSIVWAFTKSHSANWHPLTWLSHMLDCELFGLDAARHHMVSLFLHIANTLLLFWLLQKMTGALWRSAFVAAVFALHPIHVESVAWVAERKDVLSGFFWMLTIAAYLHYIKKAGTGSYLIVLLVFALGLMAKPMLVTLPFVLLLLDYWPLGLFQQRSSLRLVGEKIPFFALSAISSIITVIAQKSSGAISPIEVLPLSRRIVNALTSYLMYVEKMIWPSKLAVFYPYRLTNLLAWELLAAVLLLPLVTIRVVRLARRHGYLPTGWFWYLGTLLPVIGLVQVGDQAMADRYTYLPSIGFFIIIAWGISELSAKWRYREIKLVVLAGLVLTTLLVCTRMQVRYWQNSVTLFGHTVEVTDDNYIAHYKYGAALLKAARFDEAIAQLKESLRINPQYKKARDAMRLTLLSQGKVEEAVPFIDEILEDDENSPEMYHNLGTVYAKQGKFDEAIKNYSLALKLRPNYVSAHMNLARALVMQGKFDEAAKHCQQVLQLEPNNAQAQMMLNSLVAGQKEKSKNEKK